ncbi:AraC family transcriptional regulator [Vibrio vulnificus]|uniref:AraC family transcriptional regulator n=1 Tax=Vibrio vulnificus TaxID=672 RepID=UPI001F03603F|nr:AraC family transcriptional regulator [Vibrio vulnificus]EHH1184080.1 AraC family transcriptional regulator [Vibrio vulnificus]MCG9652783.1 AraC family transcriptional regulator [Vibrio vulnificus]
MFCTMNAFSSTNYAQEYNLEPFSHLIQHMRLDVEVYHNAQVCGNWVINKDEATHTSFHMVTKGDCRLDVPDVMQETLSTGDLVIFPKELSHRLSPITPLIGEQQHLSYAQCQDPNSTGLLCAKVEFQHIGIHGILQALPCVFVIKAEESEKWLTPIMSMILAESYQDGTGSDVIIGRLAELLFINALRAYLYSHPEQVGLLSLYAHPKLRHVISAVHQQPQHDWTLESLAKHCAMSRSALANTFRQISGSTVIEYLTWWRMQLAWSQIKAGDSIALVAESVGYRSEAAFSRAFKKAFLVSPGKARKEA